MIDSIIGKLIIKEPTFAVVDVGGMRFKINITVATYEKLPMVGNDVSPYTYLHVREDILALYGFHNELERDVFMKLINISGIGPRSAITILSGASPQEFKKRIVAEDVKSLTVIPGIGQKTAKRIILELKEKFVDEDIDIANLIGGIETNDEINDVIQALTSLGYKRAQINNALSKLKETNNLNGNLETLIKKALSKM